MLPPEEVLKPARIVCVAKTGLLGWLIRKVTKQQWNHVGLLDPPDFVLEAKDLHGTCVTKTADFFNAKGIYRIGIYEIQGLNWETKMSIMVEAYKMTGQPYDVLQLLGIYFRHRLPFLTPDKVLLDSEKKMICSEFVLRACLKAGINLCPDGIAPGLVDPGMLVAHPRIKTVYLWHKE